MILNTDFIYASSLVNLLHNLPVPEHFLIDFKKFRCVYRGDQVRMMLGPANKLPKLGEVRSIEGQTNKT